MRSCLSRLLHQKKKKMFLITCINYPFLARLDVFPKGNLAFTNEESCLYGILFFLCNCIIPAKRAKMDVYTLANKVLQVCPS